jgi:hypothetical protein
MYTICSEITDVDKLAFFFFFLQIEMVMINWGWTWRLQVYMCARVSVWVGVLLISSVGLIYSKHLATRNYQALAGWLADRQAGRQNLQSKD